MPRTPKEKTVEVEFTVPQPVLDAATDRARAEGVSLERYIRLLMERDIAGK